MIIVELAGGLANQMIIYAAARALAEKHKAELKLDLSALTRDKLRYYELFHLNITAAVATAAEIAAIKHYCPVQWIARIQQKLQKKLRISSKYIYQEPETGYDPHFWELGADIYLKGFFISRRYFEGIEDILREEFRIISPLSPQTLQLAGQMRAEQSVSLHIRRGDYATNSHTRNFHGLLGLDYYQQTMKLIEERVQNPVYYLFSDDIAWVKENLRADRPMTFIEHTTAANAYEDMYLQSRCRHNVIANSGFSYWGAWLNDHAEKIVIAPRKWFVNEAYNSCFGLLPDNWTRV